MRYLEENKLTAGKRNEHNFYHSEINHFKHGRTKQTLTNHTKTDTEERSTASSKPKSFSKIIHPSTHSEHQPFSPPSLVFTITHNLPYRVFLVVITPAGGAPPVHGAPGAATVTAADSSAAPAEATGNPTAAATSPTAARFVIVRRVPMTTATVLGDVVECGRRGGRTGRRCA